MTDTVNVPRFQMKDWRNDLSHHGVGDIAAAVEMDILLAAAPKAECELETQEREEKALRDQMFARVDRLFDAAQPEAPKVEQEPVAWMVDIYGSATVVWSRVYAERAAQNGFAVMSLYTHPAPSSDELLVALIEAIEAAALLDGEYIESDSEWIKRSEDWDTKRKTAASLITKHKGPQS